MTRDFKKESRIFQAFCDEKRLCILSFLKSNERCICELVNEMGIGQSALSYHMKILCNSGVVESRQDGKWTYYRLSKSGGDSALKILSEIITPLSENYTQTVK